MRTSIAVLLTIAVLQGCGTSDNIVGTGPVTLSMSQQRSFQTWKTATTPGVYFFLTEAGGSFRVYCPAVVTSMCDSDLPEMHQLCEERTGSTCRLYAMLDEVVWRFDGPATSFATTRFPVAARAAMPESTVDLRSLSVDWEAYPSPLTGEISVENRRRGGRVAITLPKGTAKCEGVYGFGRPTGTWFVTCPDGMTASGVYKPLGRIKGATGSGFDSKGRKLKFTVGRIITR